MSASAPDTAVDGKRTDERPRVLVKEKIGDSGVALLREHFDVDIGTDWTDEQLAERIGDYDGIVIRSATQLTPELIGRAGRLRVIGRAGVGVDNVDVESATKRGIVVANAPESNVVTAAEHTMALLLALARNVPQAYVSLTEGKWERSKFSGVELYEKTLGILGFGRIGQLVAQRARGFGMRVLAFDPFVSAERYRELRVEKAESVDDIYAQAEFITVHLPKTPETQGFLDAEAFAKMRDGVRVLNVARGGLIDEQALQEALDSGKVAGAALDVFPSEPMTEHALFAYPNVVVTPHLGASTAEATDRAGYQSAEQVVAALTGGVVSTAVNIPAIGAEDMEMLGPFLPLATHLGRLAMSLAEGSSVERIEAAFLGRIADFDTRLLGLAVIVGALQGRTEEQVNLVNAPTMAHQRGIIFEEKAISEAQDFNELIRVTVVAGDERVAVAGTGIGPNRVPHLVEVQGRRLTIELEPFVTVFRYEDLPGMIGRVGTIFGAHGVNISSAAVGHTPDGDGGEDRRLAAMVVTTDARVPEEVLEEIVASEGFVNGWSVDLG
ncbi:MAG: D-3-phosphoglycerate dehydrogenase / 2-oxoglutarate reductase [Solirubrobacteraceae bacterium]|jgi:D-3-phosphoglycerate dehydrogenase|nr:D-3-phosphoglycerate dehydrogenase / 2-oxoglutarate reductase [Solirubrobacteraceae bacterium]